MPARSTPRSFALFTLALGCTASACANYNEIRPTVPPQAVAVFNPNADRAFSARLAVGFEPNGDQAIAANGCELLQPPPGRTGELRLQVFDGDQNKVLDLYGERLLSEARPCTCVRGHFDRCVMIPRSAPRPPAP